MYTLLVEHAAASKAAADVARKDDSAEDALGPQTESIAFSAGNPRVEHMTGVVHLFRDLSEPSATDDASPVAHPVRASQHASIAPSASPRSAPHALQPPRPRRKSTHTRDAGIASCLPQADRSATLCCLSLPGDMSVANFCTFCGAYLAEMSEMRVLRREGGGQRTLQMVLLYFRSQEVADGFFDDHNGKPVGRLAGAPLPEPARAAAACRPPAWRPRGHSTAPWPAPPERRPQQPWGPAGPERPPPSPASAPPPPRRAVLAAGARGAVPPGVRARRAAAGRHGGLAARGGGGADRAAQLPRVPGAAGRAHQRRGHHGLQPPLPRRVPAQVGRRVVPRVQVRGQGLVVPGLEVLVVREPWRAGAGAGAGAAALEPRCCR
jgi:hypothetical protein